MRKRQRYIRCEYCRELMSDYFVHCKSCGAKRRKRKSN